MKEGVDKLWSVRLSVSWIQMLDSKTEGDDGNGLDTACVPIAG